MYLTPFVLKSGALSGYRRDLAQIMVTIQGQCRSPDIGLIRRLLSAHPDWGRSRLLVGLCAPRDWRAANGQLKDMACRSLLLRLGSRRAQSGCRRGNANPLTVTVTAPRLGTPSQQADRLCAEAAEAAADHLR